MFSHLAEGSESRAPTRAKIRVTLLRPARGRATRRPRVPAAPSGWPGGGADAQLGSGGCTGSAGRGLLSPLRPAQQPPFQVDSEFSS